MENSNTLYKMTKTVTHIPCPKEWESLNDWDSHRPLLWLMCENIDGGVMEFGSGFGSTPLLKERLGGLFISFDNNEDWCKKTGAKYTQAFLSISINGCKDNLKAVFVDAAPADIRKALIEKWKDVPVMVIHDTEPGADYVYHMSEILSTFKYRLDYQPEGKPHTTAVSNTINILNWV